MTECSSNEMTSLKIRRMQGVASGEKPLLPLSQILGALNVSDRALVNPNIAQPLIAWEPIYSTSIIRIAIVNYVQALDSLQKVISFDFKFWDSSGIRSECKQE